MGRPFKGFMFDNGSNPRRCHGLWRRNTPFLIERWYEFELGELLLGTCALSVVVDRGFAYGRLRGVRVGAVIARRAGVCLTKSGQVL